MLQLDSIILQQVVEKASHDAANHPRWLQAIARAIVEIADNPYLEWQDGHLLIASPSGNLYSANGVCQCRAFEFGQPCWHRAASRIVRLCMEREAAAAQPVITIVDETRIARKIAAARATAQLNELFA